MGKVIKLRPRKKEKPKESPSLKDVKPGELLAMYHRACDEEKQKNPKRYFGLEGKKKEMPEQPYLFACMKCGVTVVAGGEKLGDTRNVFIRDVDALLYKKAKVRAVMEGVPLKDWLQDAMREKLIRDPEPEEEEEE